MKHFVSLFLITTLIFCQLNVIAGPLEDKAITRLVKRLLVKEKDITNNKIDVTTRGNIVKLSGRIDTSLQANRMVELASGVKGVIDVNTDELIVKSSKEFLSDAFITAKAKGKIKYLAMSGKISPEYELHIETTNKVVHILGDVKNIKDIKTIRDSIADIIDVDSVKINIICK